MPKKKVVDVESKTSEGVEEVKESTETTEVAKDSSATETSGVMSDVSYDDIESKILSKVLESDQLKKIVAMMVERMGQQIGQILTTKMNDKFSEFEKNMKSPSSGSDVSELMSEFHQLKSSINSEINKIKSINNNSFPKPMNVTTTVPVNYGVSHRN